MRLMTSGGSRWRPRGFGASEYPARARQTAMAIVDELILLDATLVGDPIRGRSGSPASSLFKYLVSQDSYGFVRFRHIASLIIPAIHVSLLVTENYGHAIGP